MLQVSLRTFLRFFFSPSAGAAALVFFAAFEPSEVVLAGALEAVDAGALPAVEAGLGAIACVCAGCDGAKRRRDEVVVGERGMDGGRTGSRRYLYKRVFRMSLFGDRACT